MQLIRWLKKFYCNLVLVAGPSLVLINMFAAPQPGLSRTTARLGANLVLELEVATTLDQQALGLGFRTSLAPHAGMLFPCAAEQQCSFWGKNTFIPLDLVFVGPDHRIVKLTQIQPHDTVHVIGYSGAVAYVIEMNAGLADKYQLTVGAPVALKR